MILFIVYILFTHFFSTNEQEIFWKFLSSNEFSIANKTATLDLSEFAKNSQEAVENNLCLQILSIGFVRIVHDHLCEHERPPKKFNQISTNILANTSCRLHGDVTSTNYLKNSDMQDDLIFITFDGCYTTDENGKLTNGTFLVTNNVNVEFNKMLNDGYFWKLIDDDSSWWLHCNTLCYDLSIIRFYKEQTEDEKNRFLENFRFVDSRKLDWMYKVQEKPEWAKGNELIIGIVIGVFLVVVVIGVVIYLTIV